MNDNEALDPLTDAAHAAPPGPELQAERSGATGAPVASAHRVPRSPDPRDELLANLGRRFRGATLKLEFELRTAIARQIFHRDFVYGSQQLHALEASRRVQGIDRQVLKDALAAITQRADAVRTLLLSCASEARALIAAHGHAEADVSFERPAQLQATIVSPHARDFLDILGQADDALTQVEKAWLLGLLEPAEKARQASECRRALYGFKEVVRQQRHVVGLHVREVNAARRRFMAADPANDANANVGDGTGPTDGTAATADTAHSLPQRDGRGARISRTPAPDAAEVMAVADGGVPDAASNEPVADPIAHVFGSTINDGSSRA